MFIADTKKTEDELNDISWKIEKLINNEVGIDAEVRPDLVFFQSGLTMTLNSYEGEREATQIFRMAMGDKGCRFLAYCYQSRREVIFYLDKTTITDDGKFYFSGVACHDKTLTIRNLIYGEFSLIS